MTDILNAESMSTAEIRVARAALQMQEDVISFVRRMAQVDGTPASGISVSDIANVFGQEHGGGSSRPPRETNISAEHALIVELEKLCQEISFGELRTLDDKSLENVVQQLSRFEIAQSLERKALFASIDALTAQLVKRYKDDGVNVDSLLAD
ncbi:MAG: hypothetical protein EBT42_06170 [Actinobacteria bacterium]|nr:hypothetical protein [Actinomycetota bacterium]